MARYLARHGAENFKKMVVFSQPFGRIHEIWSFDMGLGPVDDQFVTELEGDIAGVVVDGEIADEGVSQIEENEV